ncbi:MAG TPA: hypothetical protein VIM16_14705 [Mucilaginibacter sp.]|jgi:hypothetical protein
MEATIKTLATKDDLADIVRDIRKSVSNVITWMFVFWIGQFGASMAILLLLLKK